MSESFSGAVEVPIVDIEKSIEGFKAVRESEVKQLLDIYYEHLGYEPRGEKVGWFTTHYVDREETFCSRYTVPYPPDNSNKIEVALRIRLEGGGSLPPYLKCFYVYEFLGDYSVVEGRLPEGLGGLVYPKVKTAWLNPAQAAFVKEFK